MAFVCIPSADSGQPWCPAFILSMDHGLWALVGNVEFQASLYLPSQYLHFMQVPG